MPEQHADMRLLASYGRRRGRKLRPGKQALVETLLPEIAVTLPGQGMLDLRALFPKQETVWLEIGFGGGEHLTHQALHHPDVGIIGCEPYINGIAALLTHIRDHKLSNIRIYNEDARRLMACLPDASIARVFMLYPDPWPKARHYKRRLVSHDTLDILARVMRPGAELRLATDDEAYCTWMLEQALSHPQFTWTAKGCGDWLKPPPEWLSTRYEQKALKAGRVPTYLNFVRRMPGTP